MTQEEKHKQYSPKPYALYENGNFIDLFPSHKAAKAAKHKMIVEAYTNMLDFNYYIKPYKL